MHWQNLYNLGGANIALFKAINGVHSPVWDEIMFAGTKLGYYYAGFGMYLAAGMLFILWRLQLLAGQKAVLPNPVELGRVLVLFTAIVCSHVVAIEIGDALKDLIHMPRPYVVLPAGDVVRIDTMLTGKNDYQSFPSNHATFMAVLLVGFWPLLSRAARVAAVPVALWVMASRIALGVHFPSDLLGGFLIGAGVTWLIRALLLKLAPPGLSLPQLRR